MATERITESSEAPVRERVIERSGGGGVGGVIIGLAVLALVAIIAFFLLGQSRNDALRTDAVTSAASSVAGAADNVGQAANSAADAVTPAPAQ